MARMFAAVLFGACLGCCRAERVQEARAPDLVDYHVHLKGGLALDEALENARQRGVKFGIAVNCGLGFPVTSDAAAEEFLKGLAGRPCYRGMQAEGREWVGLFSKEAIAKFDYVLTDAMTFRDDSGKRMRLWVDSEVEIKEEQAFMEMYVGRICGIMEGEPIDIYANATFLPRALAASYDRLWTPARMDRVIGAAVRNGVAIEIGAGLRIPSAAFVKRAKAAGAKFSFGTNNGGRDLGDLSYCIAVARECGLTQADMFVPSPEGRKPVQRRR